MRIGNALVTAGRTGALRHRHKMPKKTFCLTYLFALTPVLEFRPLICFLPDGEIQVDDES